MIAKRWNQFLESPKVSGIIFDSKSLKWIASGERPRNDDYEDIESRTKRRDSVN